MERMLITILAASLCAVSVIAAKPGPEIIRDAGTLRGREGAKVIIEGRIATEIWQHMVAPPRGYGHEAYFDIGNSQIVIYSKEVIDCAGTVRATGTVVKIEGETKNPRRKQICTEYHVAVDSWECLK